MYCTFKFQLRLVTIKQTHYVFQVRMQIEDLVGLRKKSQMGRRARTCMASHHLMSSTRRLAQETKLFAKYTYCLGRREEYSWSLRSRTNEEVLFSQIEISLFLRMALWHLRVE